MAIIRKSDPVLRAHIWLGLFLCAVPVSCAQRIDFEFEVDRAERHFYENEAGFDALGEALLAHPEIREIVYVAGQPCTIRSWTEPERPCNDAELLLHDRLIGLNFTKATALAFEYDAQGNARMREIGSGHWESYTDKARYRKVVSVDLVFSEELPPGSIDCREKSLNQPDVDCYQRLSETWALHFDGFSIGRNLEETDEVEVPGDIVWFETQMDG